MARWCAPGAGAPRCGPPPPMSPALRHAATRPKTWRQDLAPAQISPGSLSRLGVELVLLARRLARQPLHRQAQVLQLALVLAPGGRAGSWWRWCGVGEGLVGMPREFNPTRSIKPLKTLAGSSCRLGCTRLQTPPPPPPGVAPHLYSSTAALSSSFARIAAAHCSSSSRPKLIASRNWSSRSLPRITDCARANA